MRLSQGKSATEVPVTEDDYLQTVKVIDDIEDLYGNEKHWYAKGQTWITVVAIGLLIALAMFFIKRRNSQNNHY